MKKNISQKKMFLRNYYKSEQFWKSGQVILLQIGVYSLQIGTCFIKLGQLLEISSEQKLYFSSILDRKPLAININSKD